MQRGEYLPLANRLDGTALCPAAPSEAERGSRAAPAGRRPGPGARAPLLSLPGDAPKVLSALEAESRLRSLGSRALPEGLEGDPGLVPFVVLERWYRLAREPARLSPGD